jgi:hypothetical protein
MTEDHKDTEADIKARKAAIWSQLMGIGLDFALYLAIPLFAFIFAGKWLDTKYNRHFFVIIGLLVALTLSWYLIYKKIKEVKDLMDKK